MQPVYINAVASLGTRVFVLISCQVLQTDVQIALHTRAFAQV